MIGLIVAIAEFACIIILLIGIVAHGKKDKELITQLDRQIDKASVQNWQLNKIAYWYDVYKDSEWRDMKLLGDILDNGWKGK